MSREGRPPSGRVSRGTGDDRTAVDAKPENPTAPGAWPGTDQPAAEAANGVDKSDFPDREKPSAPVWVRLTGAGMELAFITIVFGAIGILIDRHFKLTRPIYSAVGGMLGFTFGMVRFIRMATQVSQAQRTIERTRSFDAPSRSGASSNHDAKERPPAATDEETHGSSVGDQESY